MATFVLVHGSWQGSWAWERLEPLLQAHGHATIAVDLPGNGHAPVPDGPVTLDLLAEHVSAVVDRAPPPVVLVGHSGGGIVVAETAERRPDALAATVYVCAFLLRSGESIESFYAEHLQPWMQGAVRRISWSEDRQWSRIDPHSAVEVFYQCSAEEVARTTAARLSAQPELPKRTPLRLSTARFDRVPRYYIETLQDRSVHIELQRIMQQQTPCRGSFTLDTDHAPQLSAPQALAESLLRVAATFD